MMSIVLPSAKEVDFTVLKEDWSRYLVNDGTELRIRVVVRKILEIDQPALSGYPNFELDSINVISALVPDKQKRQPSSKPFDAERDKGEEINFVTQDEQWQQYQTTDGFKLLIKPVLVKVIRYNSYNIFGEPVYHTNIQDIVNAEKNSK